MRVSTKQLMVVSWLLAAGCGGGVDTQPDDTGDAAVGSGDAGTRDAGRRDGGSTNPDPGSTGDTGDQMDGGDGTGTGADTGTAKDAGKHDAGGSTSGNDAAVVASSGETGRLVGMTAAHNAVRAMVQTNPMLGDMVWDDTLAAYAQQWADTLAGTQSTCDMPHHRDPNTLMQIGYGENLAAYRAKAFGGQPLTTASSTPQKAVDGWAAEVACWTYGTISFPPKYIGTEKCDSTCYLNMGSDGCGHYTQVVWRKSTKLGCGVSTCVRSDGFTEDIWICNYDPAGNVALQAPY